jgi:NAD(P)-dependent dehydrogenase (short-subunit alcohol dehydrogenase family)
VRPFAANHWALILGGSSGLGLAAADKLSRHGMNIALVHRDRQGAMDRIQPAFDAIAARVRFRAWNLNALTLEGQEKVLGELRTWMGADGRVRLLLHSIAFGNLRPVMPVLPRRTAKPYAALAETLGIAPEKLLEAAQKLIDSDHPGLTTLLDAQPFDPSSGLLEEEDFAHTLHAMGTSLIRWVQGAVAHKLFAADGRILALTSEGNRIQWRGYGAVAAAKGALESAVRTLAAECAPHGLRCNVLQAGVTQTPGSSLIPGSAQLRALARARNPFQRLTTPEDVADVICLLATDEAAWINGAHLHVDGGEHLG